MIIGSIIILWTTLLNGGIDTGNTQTGREGGHDGSDDARSVIVLGSHALVLPTRDELVAFRSDQGVSPWVGVNIFWTATLAGGGMHSRYSLATGSTFNVGDTNRAGVVFQVLTALINPPATPGNVRLTPGNGQIIVTWTSVPVTDNGGAAITGYTATAGTLGETARTCTADGPTATTCTITGLTNSSTYSVFVFATNSAGDSAESPAQIAIPLQPLPPTAAPGGVMLTPGNEQIIVTWTSVPAANNGGAVISGYTATATASGETDPNLRRYRPHRHHLHHQGSHQLD